MHGLGPLEVAELLDRLLRHDPHHGVGQVVEEPAERLVEHEANGVLVGRVDLLDGAEHRTVRIALDRQEAFVRVFHVLRRQLAPVHRRLVVPANALPELEDVGPIVGLRPRFGQVRLDRQGAGHDRGARLHLHQAAMREGEIRRDPVVVRGEMGIETGGRVLAPDAEHAAALRCLCLGRTTVEERQRGSGGDGDATELEQLSAADGGRRYGCAIGSPSCVSRLWVGLDSMSAAAIDQARAVRLRL